MGGPFGVTTPTTDQGPPTRGKPLSARTSVTLLTLVVALLFSGGILFDRLLVRLSLRRIVDETRSGETLLDAIRMKASPDFTVADLLRVYPGATGGESFLAGISWSPPPVPIPFLGTGPREGRSANATINRHHFRDARPEYGPKAPGEVRVFLTGGSVAYGTGAPSQRETIAGFLEDALNRDASVEGRRYLVINTGVPAYTSTHERLIVELKVSVLQPDVVLMLSGTNDVHWAANGYDVRGLRTYDEAHFDAMASRAYGLAGLEWPALGLSAGPIAEPEEVARRLASNVEAAARFARAAGARLVFALQPTIGSTGKRLSGREKRLLAQMPQPGLWSPCLDAIRRRVSMLSPEVGFTDLSSAFAGAPETEEWFVDSYHLGPKASREVAARLALVVRQAMGPPPAASSPVQ